MRTNVLLLSAGVAAALVARRLRRRRRGDHGRTGVLRRPVSGARDQRIRAVRGRARAADAPQQSDAAVDEPDADGSPVTDARRHAASVDAALAHAAGRRPRPRRRRPRRRRRRRHPTSARRSTGQPEAPGGPPAVADARCPGARARTTQQAWLAFQQLVRECMADAGHEYLAWEWWNPAPDTSNRFPRDARRPHARGVRGVEARPRRRRRHGWRVPVAGRRLLGLRGARHRRIALIAALRARGRRRRRREPLHAAAPCQRHRAAAARPTTAERTDASRPSRRVAQASATSSRRAVQRAASVARVGRRMPRAVLESASDRTRNVTAARGTPSRSPARASASTTRSPP